MQTINSLASPLAPALALFFVLSAPAYPASPSSDALQFDSLPLAIAAAPLEFPALPASFPSVPIETETAATIEITLPADILFDFDKSEIRPTAQSALHEVADLIRGKARGPVTIRGYTDALGKSAYNQSLSERRASAVKGWLQIKETLSSTRFIVIGFGSSSPVAPNRTPDGSDDPEGRQLNRRVTLIIRK